MKTIFIKQLFVAIFMIVNLSAQSNLLFNKLTKEAKLTDK